jgi:hypothetical protein
MRDRESVQLDETTTVPFVRWDRFLELTSFEQGQHITIVGTTGSGKTVLMRELLEQRSYVVVLGTKNEDPELYEPFERQGYRVVDEFNPTPPGGESRIIFRPRMTTPDKAGRQHQAAKFRVMLFKAFEAGGWTVAVDELWVVAKPLGLADTLEEFWSQGRSLKLTVVGGTQKPVDIPLLAFDQATHLFLFRNTDRYRIQRMAEFAGTDRRMVAELIPRLPEHEFLYVQTRSGTLLRSKVLL